jgi:surface polysaccharide O-acyltransferase-like enzyme
MENAYRFLKKHGRLLPSIFLLTLLCYAVYFDFQINNQNDAFTYALSVLQPSVMIYSTIVIIFFSYLSTLWVKKQSFMPIIKMVSDASFGIFFVHVLILNLLVSYALPLISPVLPPLLTVSYITFATFFLSICVCVFIMKIPYLRWAIGR